MIRIIQIIISAFTLALIVCGCSPEKKSGEISGKLKNADNSWISLQVITERGDSTIDSVQTDSDGSFSLRNTATSPEFYVLRTSPSQVVFLVLKENENVIVNGDATNIENTYTVSGSKDSELIRELREHDRLLNDSISRIYVTVRDRNPEQKDSIGYILQSAYSEEMENFSVDFIKKNITSVVSLSATKFVNQQSYLPLLNELRDSLVRTLPGNKFVADYSSLIDEANRLPAGSKVPEISLMSDEGKKISLSSFKGKVILIDFWASWCMPCRAENPNLVKMYDRLKGQNFEILGVSLDDNEVAWKNAVKKDGLKWPQVSELKKWESKVIRDFHIEAIPYSVLVDQKGNIIAKGIQGSELELMINKALRENF